ncbi:adenylate/guanylate cyclase domain-containing protein [Conexibacter sp. DBS9H8]|uniref:adenylate/guanylate cyclase domain-containing protein n=1 Tax=Conexibacter sp. DBS9H8 TaxID=2937801 RepID=UPI00200D77D9|nr:adenylate/guanylate cyclase domain-containing protein [Conexibacter sp. DBS9H8]
MAPEERSDGALAQAAGRAAGLVGRFLSELDGQPIAGALSPLAQRLGLTPEVDGLAVETTLLFSDLAGFATWVLDAGDDRALELLRALGTVAEPLIGAHRGRLVKRLGSGHMAAFRRPRDGLAAALAMIDRTTPLATEPDHPRLRIGLHVGTPQRVDGDYFGRDVNITARLAEAAAPGQILVSGAVLGAVGSDMLAGLVIERRPRFRAKGTPADLDVFAVAGAVS